MGWPKGVPTHRTLSDADLLAIAAAPGDVPSTVLAQQLGKPYFTVAHARRKMEREGGWLSPLEWVPCSECGQPVASSPLNGRRGLHLACQRARTARKARERRALPDHPKSTPYVAAWRQQNPQGNARLRQQEKARLRALWPSLPADVRTEVLERVHQADQRDYPITLEQADRSGADWTEKEDAYLLAHLNTPAREVALALGRTLWAVRNRRVRLRRWQEG